MELTRTRFLVEPIAAADLAAVRQTGRDIAGNPFTPFTADGDGAPLRCCLREAVPGERIALIAYQPPGTA
jgi:hypothetical protein